jgi:DNA-binding beta-propeller fold protein YncE
MTSPIFCLDCSPTAAGRCILSGYLALKVFSTLLWLAGALSVVPALAGTLLVANKSSATLTLVDARSGEVIEVLPTGVGPHEVDVSPDGRTAVVANYGFIRGGNSLTVIDVPSATVAGTINLGEHSRPHGVAWLQDNRRVAVTTEGSRHLLVVDVDAGEITAAYPTGQDGSHMVAIAQGEDPVAFVANMRSGSVTRIGLGSGDVVSKRTGAGAEGIAVSPDGGTVWIAHRAENSLKVLDADTLDTIADLETGSFPIRVEFTHDGRYVVVSNARSDTFSVYDAIALALVREIDLELEGRTRTGLSGFFAGLFGSSNATVPIGIQPAPGRLWIALANADRVAEVDTEAWTVTRTVEAGREPDGMGWSPLTAGIDAD